MESIPVYKDHLVYIDGIFNICLGEGNSPIIKLGFLGNTNHILDRMFVIDDNEIMILFAKTVQFGTDEGEYRRSIYIMTRSKINLIHFDTKTVFGDLFDYSHIETSEISKNIIFVYNNTIYESISQISSIDPDYKSKTKIYDKTGNYELQNSIYQYSRIFPGEISKKIGYYVTDENIKYFHVIHFIPGMFGKIPNLQQFFNLLQSDYNNIQKLVFTIFEDPLGGITKKGKKKNPHIGVNLINRLTKDNDLQSKKMTIGWFLCEIMYSFIFLNF